MKKQHLLLSAFSLLAFSTTLFAKTEEARNVRMANGELITRYNYSMALPKGPVDIDLMAKTITAKGSLLPVTLWEDADGVVQKKRHQAVNRVHRIVSKSANPVEEEYYRDIFPKKA